MDFESICLSDVLRTGSSPNVINIKVNGSKIMKSIWFHIKEQTTKILSKDIVIWYNSHDTIISLYSSLTKNITHHLNVFTYTKTQFIFFQEIFHKNSQTIHLYCFSHYQKYICQIFSLWTYPKSKMEFWLCSSFHDSSITVLELIGGFWIFLVQLITTFKQAWHYCFWVSGHKI